MNELSQSEENHLKAIYHIEYSSDGPVSTNELADKMNTKASSVTDMIRRLAEKKMINYQKYKGCELTDKGRKEALKTIRKHRLWETFLVEKLGFSWDEVHDVAEQLEHVKSAKLTDRLEELLGFPKFDPHGDPIPNKEGGITHTISFKYLSELSVGTKGNIVGVSDSSTSFLKYLDKYKIGLGGVIEVKERFEFDHSMEVIIDGNLLNLSAAASSKIRIETL